MPGPNDDESDQMDENSQYGGDAGGDRDFVAHPHDAFVKTILSDHDNAVAFLRSQLPTELAQACQWSTLRPETGSFVKESLGQLRGDLLFSVRLESNAAEADALVSSDSDELGRGNDCLIHIHIEHQTTVDKSMPLRLLEYQIAIMRALQKSNGLPVPPVVSLVFHQGPEGWTAAREFAGIVALPEDPELRRLLVNYIPNFLYALLDLPDHDPETENDPLLRVQLQLMKMIREQSAADFLRWLLVQELLQKLGDADLELMFRYLYHADDKLDFEQVNAIVAQNKKLKKLNMTLADKLIARGKAEGMAEGEARGEARGIWIGRIQMLEEMLGKTPTARSELEQKKLEQLEKSYRRLQREYDSRFKS